MKLAEGGSYTVKGKHISQMFGSFEKYVQAGSTGDALINIYEGSFFISSP